MKDTLILGTNIEIISDLISKNGEFIDCTITSPPYNKYEKKNSGKITKAVIYDNFSDSKPEEFYQQEQIDLLSKIWEGTFPGGSCFYNHKVRYINGSAISPFNWLNKTPWKLKQEIIWDRVIASNIRGWRFWNVDERIYWLYKPLNKNDRGIELKSKWAKMGSIWRFPPETKIKNHPAPFPKELPKRIIMSLYDNNSHKTILDPYIGSGTTAVVAKELGHHYIGIDISESYLKIAKERIDESCVYDTGISQLFEN